MSNLGSSVPASPRPGSIIDAVMFTQSKSLQRRYEGYSRPALRSSPKYVCMKTEVKILERYFEAFRSQDNDRVHQYLIRAGVPIRKPGQTVESLIRERREQLRYRSGIAEADTELKQAVDVFLQRYDAVDQEDRDLSAEKEELAENKRKANAIRDPMMFGRERSDETEGGIDDKISETQSGKKRTRLSMTDMLATTISSSTGPITNAITRLADALQPSAYDDSIGSMSFDRITEVEVQIHEVEKKVTELSKQVAETFKDIKNMLKR
ncbi:hypothetical protein V1527DRAFT_450431 [Lipomyces starkeyi]